jgi:hemerythrin-like metal-binding protein
MFGHEWTPSMSVGLDALDNDHIRLIEILNCLEEASTRKQDFVTLLSDLVTRSSEHFVREEAIIKDLGFPQTDVHMAEHRIFQDVLVHISTRYRPLWSPALMRASVDYLREWLMHHILLQDMAYKPFIIGPQIKTTIHLPDAIDPRNALQNMKSQPSINAPCDNRGAAW